MFEVRNLAKIHKKFLENEKYRGTAKIKESASRIVILYFK